MSKRRKRHSPEQIVKKLRDGEAMLNAGKDLAAVLSELHRDVLDLMGLTGCRSGELLSLTTGDLNRSGDPWRADLKEHKTRHFGKDRVLFFNTVAQSILMKYLKADPSAKLFPIRRIGLPPFSVPGVMRVRVG